MNGADGGLGWALLQFVLFFAAVLGLVWVGTRLAGRRLGGRGGLYLRTVDVLTLTPRSHLHLVEIGGRWLVVGTGDGGVRLVADLGPVEAGLYQEPVPGPGEGTGAFARWLRQRLGRFGSRSVTVGEETEWLAHEEDYSRS